MSIHLTEFPLSTKVSGWTSVPRFKTTIVQPGGSGHESRNADWQDGLHRYNAAFAVKTKEDAEILKAFFMVVRGRETSFLVKDWQDYQLNEDLSDFPENTPDGSRVNYQLYKAYQDALVNFHQRTIAKPKVSTLVVRDNGSIVSSMDYSVAPATGIITFDTAPLTGHTINAVCEFYVPCRFDVDELPIEIMHYPDSGDALVQFVDVPMVEVRGE